MKNKIIEIEADSLNEAREKAQAQVPEGWKLLSTKVVSDRRQKTVRASAESPKQSATGC
jgi:hypothetical protein